MGMVKWPFQRISDLQLGDQKGHDLNHLVDVCDVMFFVGENMWLLKSGKVKAEVEKQN